MEPHEIYTELLSLPALRPQLAEQFRGALAADTQQSNLREGEAMGMRSAEAREGGTDSGARGRGEWGAGGNHA